MVNRILQQDKKYILEEMDIHGIINALEKRTYSHPDDIAILYERLRAFAFRADACIRGIEYAYEPNVWVRARNRPPVKITHNGVEHAPGMTKIGFPRDNAGEHDNTRPGRRKFVPGCPCELEVQAFVNGAREVQKVRCRFIGWTVGNNAMIEYGWTGEGLRQVLPGIKGLERIA